MLYCDRNSVVTEIYKGKPIGLYLSAVFRQFMREWPRAVQLVSRVYSTEEYYTFNVPVNRGNVIICYEHQNKQRTGNRATVSAISRHPDRIRIVKEIIKEEEK